MLKNFSILIIRLFVGLIVFAQFVNAFNSYSADVHTLSLDVFGIPGPYRFESLCLNNKKELWSVGGGGKVYLYEDGAEKRVVYNLENKTLFNGGFYGVFCNNAGDVWAVGGNGVIFHTSNKGIDWQLQKSNLKQDFNLNAITCIDETCWIVGDNGTLLTTDDKGKIWNKFYLKAEEDLKDIFFINKQVGWIIGGEGGIWKTVDGGKNWSFQELMIDNEYAHSLSIKFHNENDGWISGFDFIARTENGGKTWEITEVDGQFIGIVTHDGKNVWAIKRGGNYCSTDAGKTWSRCCIDME